MAKGYNLTASVRKEDPRALRRNGRLPAVLYGHGTPSASIELDTKAFMKVYKEAGSTSLLTLSVDDSPHTVLVRDIQYHPLKNAILHVDFYQVRLDEEIDAEVPLVFIGEAPAVKDLGGVLVRNIDEVEISALPQNLPHDIQVDISVLDNFEKVIRISDLKVPEGVQLRHEAEDVVALVQEPRSQEEIDAELSAEVKEDVENVEGVKKEEPPAEGEAPAEGEEKKE